MKLSLWLVPAAEDARRFEELIQRCATAFGSPTFPPHITICSEPLEAALRADLALELPLGVSFGSVGFDSDYFHCCFLQARDDAGLLALQARCAAALRGAVPKYAPHLSLAYGALTEAQREAARSLVPSLPLAGKFDQLELWETSGPVPSWRRVAG